MLIYVASPYSHKYKDVMEDRYHQVENYVQYHFLKTPRLVRISPIVMWHNAAKRLEMPTDAELYKKTNQSLLIRCDLVEVLRLEGWKESVGCRMEIEWARDYDIKIEYVDPLIS